MPKLPAPFCPKANLSTNMCCLLNCSHFSSHSCSSGDSRDTPASDAVDLFQAQQQSSGGNNGSGGSNSSNNGQGFIPQIVMNPWDPNQTPVMTLAPLANAMQAYHQQMLLQQQQEQAEGGGEGTSASRVPKVMCVTPHDEMGFLLDLPPPCNVILQPSSIGLSGKPPPESPFQIAFTLFLSGEYRRRARDTSCLSRRELCRIQFRVPLYAKISIRATCMVWAWDRLI